MAGQSPYEMMHSMVIAPGGILLFVTDLERVADETTREREVGLLCYWMQLAHIRMPDPSRVRVLVVGTRKAKSSEDTLHILKCCLAKQLAVKVYNLWIRTRQDDECTEDRLKFFAIENSESLNHPRASGLKELEEAVKAASDKVVASRGAVPLRWLAFVDKLKRKSRTSSQICFSWGEVQQVAVDFPGFADDERERTRDLLEGLRCLAAMGRLVLLQLGKEEWYIFTEGQKIIDFMRKVTAPTERLRDRLSVEDIRGLNQGRISHSALFTLWDGYEEGDKKLMLKLLCQFDLLMLLEGGVKTIGDGSATVGVPALTPYGRDDFDWGRAAGEKDLELTTKFPDAFPNGLLGGLIAHMYRTLTLAERDSPCKTGPSPRVRADGALFRVQDGSRVIVGFKCAVGQLRWKFRGLRPVSLAQECIREVENLLNKPLSH